MPSELGSTRVKGLVAECELGANSREPGQVGKGRARVRVCVLFVPFHAAETKHALSIAIETKHRSPNELSKGWYVCGENQDCSGLKYSLATS